MFPLHGLMECIYIELKNQAACVCVCVCVLGEGRGVSAGAVLLLLTLARADKHQLLLSVHITVIKPCWQRIRCSSPPLAFVPCFRIILHY